MKEDADHKNISDLGGKTIDVQLGTTGDILVSEAVNGSGG